MPKNYYNYVIETKLQNRISSNQRDAMINSVVGFPASDDMARLETGRIGNIFIGIGRPNGGGLIENFRFATIGIGFRSDSDDRHRFLEVFPNLKYFSPNNNLIPWWGTPVFLSYYR